MRHEFNVNKMCCNDVKRRKKHEYKLVSLMYAIICNERWPGLSG